MSRFFLYFFLLLIAPVAYCDELPESDIQSTYTAQIVRSLFESGAFSFHFDADIKNVAQTYTQKTRYAGKVRTNQPLLPGYLNIYVFKKAEGFRYEGLFRDTCRALRDAEVIICDSEFLDSMPTSPPVLFNGGSDTVPPSALLYWVIGHEIGHLVLRHTSSAFSLSLPPLDITSIAPRETTEVMPNKSTSKEETEADRFAVSGMPIRSSYDWVYFGNPLVDALLHEIGRKGIMSGVEDADAAPPKLTVRSDTSGHPPLIMRLYDLLATIRRNYSDFPFPEGYTPKVEFNFSESAEREYASPFYEGFYLGSADDRFTHATRLLDLATYLLVTNRVGQMTGLRRRLCDGTPSLDEISEVQRSIVCDRPLSKQIMTTLSSCDQLYREASFRCYAQIPLIAINCRLKEGKNEVAGDYCKDIPEIDRIYMNYAGRPFAMPTDMAGLLNWSLAAQYYYQMIVTRRIDDALLEWIMGVAEQAGVADQSSVGLEILLAHAEFLEKQQPSNWESLAQLDSVIADRGLKVGNDELALLYQKKTVELIATNVDKDSPVLAIQIMKLVRIMRDYHMYNIGSSDARASGLFDEDLAEGLKYPTTDLVKKSAELAEDASNIYQRLIIRLETAKSVDVATIGNLRMNYINAMGGAIFSYNMALELERALEASVKLHAELERHTELAAREGYNKSVLAPAIENIALAYVASPNGNARVAIQLANTALEIRRANKQDTLLPLRIISYAHYRLEEFHMAAKVAKTYIDEFEAKTHRRFPLATGTMVGGRVVTVEDIFRQEASRSEQGGK